jgi:UDP-2,3-diacylglucosamine hydrolase
MGIEVIDGVLYRNIMGANFIITHGDGVGKRKLSFRTIRSIFRNKFCQLLYASIHPRWTIPFALKWSSSNRKSHESPINTEIEKEINNLTNWANNQLSAKHETNYFVFGHVHYPYKTTLRINIENISKTEMHSAEMAILGDWFSNSSYAAFDGNELFISNWE